MVVLVNIRRFSVGLTAFVFSLVSFLASSACLQDSLLGVRCLF